MKILINIGCIECGVDSNIVGIFDDDTAIKYQDILDDKCAWRQGGQNSFECFDIPEHGTVTEEYKQYLLEEGPVK